MKQLRLFYENIPYNGIKQNFYYHGMQEGFAHIPDIALYNGTKEKHTISDKTLEAIVRGINIK